MLRGHRRNAAPGGLLGWLVAVGCGAVAACSLTTDLDGLTSESTATSTAAATGVTSGPGTGGSGAEGAQGPGGAGTGGGGTGGATTTTSAGTGGAGGGAVYDPPWWDPAWKRRVRIDVKNEAVTTLPAGFEVGFSVDLDATFGGGVDPSSLRAVSWANGWTPIPTFTEAAGGKTWVWLASPDPIQPAITVDHYWLYADNPSPPAPDDPATVFTELWQPFDDLAGWEQLGTPVLVAGSVELESGDSIRTLQGFAPGIAVDFSLTVLQQVGCVGCWISAGYQRLADFENYDPWVLWISRDLTKQITPEALIYRGSTTDIDGSPIDVTMNETHVYGVERLADQCIWRYDNALAEQHKFTSAFGEDMQVRLAIVGTGQARFGFARARQAVDPAPSVSLVGVEVLQ